MKGQEDWSIFNNALKTATAEISSEGELIFYDIEGATQDAKNDTFTISLNELVRFYYALKQEFDR